jgi:hypothetical protein
VQQLGQGCGRPELQTEHLLDLEVHPQSNASTGVNAIGYRNGGPPPGWPDDPAEYGPGEGPRHAEDFHLHEVSFPICVIPPDRWDGYAGLSSSSSSGQDVTHVAFGYFDEPGGSRRGLEIVNAGPDQRSWVRPVRQEDVGVWWSDRVPDDDVENFAARFISRDDHASLQGEHGFLDAGRYEWLRSWNSRPSADTFKPSAASSADSLHSARSGSRSPDQG